MTLRTIICVFGTFKAIARFPNYNFDLIDVTITLTLKTPRKKLDMFLVPRKCGNILCVFQYLII